MRSVRLFELLRADAQRFPDKLAAVFPGREQVTFGELDDRSDRVAARLRKLGIGPGDRVAIFHDNSLPGLVWFWGVQKVGAQTIDVPTLAGKPTIQGVLDEARPKAIAFDAKQRKQLEGAEPLRLPPSWLASGDVAELAKAHGARLHALDEILATEHATCDVPAGGPDDVALVVYTSGTTGRPNGVMLSHTNFVSNLRAANELMHLGADDSILVVVPLYYIHGRMQLLLHTMLGGTLYFSAGFQFPAKVHAELVEHGTTGFSGVPYHFKQLLERSKIAESPPPSLRYVLITGGALTPAELRRLADALPNTGIHLAYGQTEAAPRITWIGPDTLFAKPGSLGRALPGVNVEILGADGLPVGPGQIGEVVAGGPNIMKGYVSGDERALGKIDAAGRLRTGDLGYLDADGDLFLVGRSSEMIKSAGERIFPQEVEDVVGRHPRVREVAVIGVPDATLGEKLVAYVALHPGPEIDLSDFRAHCLQSLPFVRVPKSFEIVGELPKTASGKISRSAIRKAVLEGTPVEAAKIDEGS
ncbi:MAG TPA: class I adenylate-forming enzyme family protein [Nannocystaceae bacterium]|nr:class I adenylate-forming enzyme family protein [Nannocystaceae bacterium]